MCLVKQGGTIFFKFIYDFFCGTFSFFKMLKLKCYGKYSFEEKKN